MSRKILLVILLAISTGGCKLASVKYAFSGVNLSPEVKTFSVDYFTNKTPFAPNLGSDFTEALKEYLRNRTNLTEVTDNDGDIRFEGQITGFSQTPMEIQKNEVAASNKLTITIRVKFTNTKDEESSFDSSFSHYEIYSIDENYDAIEADLLKKITDKIIDDVFNKALVNW